MESYYYSHSPVNSTTKDCIDTTSSSSAYSACYSQQPQVQGAPPPPSSHCAGSNPDPWNSPQFGYPPSHHQYYPHSHSSLYYHGAPDYTNYEQTMCGNGNSGYYHPIQPTYNTAPYGNEEQDDDENRPVVSLENKELWQTFHSAGTEMIITKTGR